MRYIGIISDTHNIFDKKLRDFLAPVDEIWHAGDIGTLPLADEIAAFKPLRAVWGNIDGAELRRAYRGMTTFEVEGVRITMMHIGGYPNRYQPQAIAEIVAQRPKIFVAGHSHILKVIYDKKYDLLHLNPGAAGCHGIHKVRTALRLKIDGERIYDLEVGEWER